MKIVDEFTGRILEGRRWSEGLHQAVEAKEGVKIKEENQTLATITLQNYFRMYDKLAGMTGTAATEAAELMNTYDLQVVPIPTNRPMVRADEADLIYKTEVAKFDAVVDDLVERYETGPAGARRHHLGGEVRVPLQPARASGASPTRCSTPSSTPGRRDRRPGRPARRRHRRHQHGRSRRRHPPRRQPRGPGPPGGAAARASRPRRWSTSSTCRSRSPSCPRSTRRLRSEAQARYDELLEQFSDECRGRGRQGPRARRPVRARHRAPREPPHRQPAPRPLRPPGRPRREPLLPVPRRRADAPVRHRRHAAG